MTDLSSSLETEKAATKEAKVTDSSSLDPKQAEYTALLNPAESGAGARARARLKQASSALEFKIDTFAEGVHKLAMLNEVAKESADGIMAEASNSLQQRHDAETVRAGGSKGSVNDILRALSRTTG